MFVSDTGASRQVKLTPLRLKLGAGALAAMFVLSCFGVVGVAGLAARGAAPSGDRDALIRKIQDLEESLKKKDALISASTRPFETPVVSEKAAAEGTASTEPESPGTAPETGEPERTAEHPTSREAGPLSSLPRTPLTDMEGSRGQQEAEQPSPASVPATAGAGPGARLQDAPTAADNEKPEPAQAVLAFDARDVAASSPASDRGTIRFRLFKDHPEVLFSGYLFVFVEMVNAKGESKLIAYPKRARLGEGDMPSDPKDGERLKFRYNTSVELSYRDTSDGSSIGSVSVLLYGEDGRSIVYQRGFGRKEVKIAESASARPEPSREKRGKERRAL
jgi:hypothetical protein